MPINIPPQVNEAVAKLTIAVRKVVFDPQISQQLVKMMRTGEPAQAVARAAGAVMNKLAESKEGANGMAQAVAPMLVAELITLGDAAGAFKKSPELYQQALTLVQKPASTPQAQPAQPAQQPAPAGLIAGGPPQAAPAAAAQPAQ